MIKKTPAIHFGSVKILRTVFRKRQSKSSEDHAEAVAFLAFFPPFFFPPDFRFAPLFFLETPRFLAFFGLTELAMDDLGLPAALRAITTIRVLKRIE